MRLKLLNLMKQSQNKTHRAETYFSHTADFAPQSGSGISSQSIRVSAASEPKHVGAVEAPIYNVSETFLSIQGEGGPGLGRLAYFVRLQICNLRCDFCDTKFTWTLTSDPIDPKTSKGKQKWDPLTHTDLIALLKSQPSKRIIFTGGEPLITNISRIIADLGEDYEFEVETNGTIIPQEHHGAAWISGTELRVQWNVSPKFKSNSRQVLNERAMQWWSDQQGSLNIFFKFVVRHKDNEEFDRQLDEVLEMVRQYGLDKRKVLIMLEGITFESQTQNLAYYIERIVAAGLNWSPRLHILVWGDKRGV